MILTLTALCLETLSHAHSSPRQSLALSLATFCSLPADAVSRDKGIIRGAHRAWSSRKATSEYQGRPVRAHGRASDHHATARCERSPPTPRWRGSRDPRDGRAGQAYRRKAHGERRNLHRLQVNERARGRIFPRSYGAGRYLSITLGSVLLAFVLLHATAAQEYERRRHPLGRTHRANCRITYGTGPARCGRGRHRAARGQVRSTCRFRERGGGSLRRVLAMADAGRQRPVGACARWELPSW